MSGVWRSAWALAPTARSSTAKKIVSFLMVNISRVACGPIVAYLCDLTLRMSNRRFTRLTNAFSKKVDNHGHMVALHYMHYNFCRVHKTLRVTPAMEAGISDHVWSIEELCALLPKPVVSASQIEKNLLLRALETA